MPHHSRRDFLATTSLALAGTMLDARALFAQRLPFAVASSSQSANTLLPEPMIPLDLRTIATRAIDAARSAGASYADIRVAERQRLDLHFNYFYTEPNVILGAMFTYGLRVMVDGTWTFVHGRVPSIDAVTASAYDAVTTARGYARLTTRRIELAPTPVVTGEWATPIQVDPFAVPLRDQTAMMGALTQAAKRVRHIIDGGGSFKWERDTRVFASSEGALITQTLRRSAPFVYVTGNCDMGKVGLPVPHFCTVSGGYETVSDPRLQDEMKALSEEVARIASLPRRALDVGRYPVILDGATLGMMLGRTLGSALELDRVLGYEADASGTSFLSPPSDLLDTPVVSPLLTVTGHRALPSVSAVKWDDEGVEPQEFSVIREGRLVNYHTSRQTASTLRSSYERQGHSVRSNGCTVASNANDPVLVRSPHLVVAPSTKSVTAEDLCRGVTRGLLVRDRSYLSTDQQLASGSLTIERGNTFGGVMFEIEKGKIVRRVEGNGFVFRTRSFWESLVALGGVSTVRDNAFMTHKGMPWQGAYQSTTAPAGLVKDVNVVTTHGRA